MRTADLAIAGLATVTGLAIALGLYATGGPDQARQQRRDEYRLADLGRLKTTLDCLAAQNGGIVPAEMQPTGDCLFPDLPTEPVTGAPYGYVRTGDTSYQLCAAFETDLGHLPVYQSRHFDPATGCFSYRYP